VKAAGAAGGERRLLVPHDHAKRPGTLMGAVSRGVRRSGGLRGRPGQPLAASFVDRQGGGPPVTTNAGGLSTNDPKRRSPAPSRRGRAALPCRPGTAFSPIGCGEVGWRDCPSVSGRTLGAVLIE
jgi:hypothetical protein